MLRRIPGFVGLVVLFVCLLVCSGFVVFFGGDRFIYDSFAYFGVSFTQFFANDFFFYIISLVMAYQMLNVCVLYRSYHPC